jgi:serine/threonine protein phosphatase 1
MPRYAISDIHGCAQTFLRLLRKIDLQRTDELFLLGDYIDRGPSSRAVLEFIWQLQGEGYRVHCLRGNHEQMLLDALTSGGRPWDYFPRRNHIEETLDWIRTLPYFLETKGYILVHAGLNFTTGFPLVDQEAMLWARGWEHLTDRQWLAGRIIVYGHTPATGVAIRQNLDYLNAAGRICIDNGCALAEPGMGQLVALNLDERTLTFEPYWEG